MFYVVYEFNVAPENTEEFKKIWHEFTLEIRTHSGGLGSRLHKAFNKEDTWVAYAQWPNREQWLNFSALHIEKQAPLLLRSQALCKRGVQIIYELEMVDDLLLPITPDGV